VAEAAVDLLHPGMDAVAEEDRLLRADPFQGEKIVKVPHGRKKDCPDYQPYVTAFHRSRLWIVVRHIRITDVRIQKLDDALENYRPKRKSSFRAREARPEIQSRHRRDSNNPGSPLSRG
jgi:hypothetical protein